MIDFFSYLLGKENGGTDTSSATATASDILTGKTAYISDGTEATGTCDFNADTTDATAVENSLLYGHTAYGADGSKLTGTGAYWQYAKQLRDTFNGSTTLTGAVDLYVPLLTGSVALYNAFLGCTGITSLTLTWSGTGFGTTAMYRSFYQMANVKTITLNGSVIGTTQFQETFRECTSLVTIGGQALDFTNQNPTYGNTFTNCAALVNVAFVAGTIQGAIRFADSPLLSTTSLLSIANGLKVTAATMTMHETSKTNMDNINVDVVDGVAVLGTTKTLTQFITTDKGWTIA